MSSSTNNSGGGVGLGGLLLILFIALKLTGQITWSWFWVLSPLWISFALLALIFGIGAVVVFVKERRS